MPVPAWQPWATPAFQLAQRTRRPVLLLLDTAWSSPSRALRDEALASPAVAERLAAGFVPVHVDADWRPDIADRYGLGAWPTLLALSPEGHVLGGGVGGPRDLPGWLDRTRDLFGRHDGQLRPEPRLTVPASADAAGPAPAAGLAATYGALEVAVDAEHGTFGAGNGPVLAPVLAVLACAAAGWGDALAPQAAQTIDALLQGPRWDAASGVLCCRGATPFEAGEAFGRLDEQAEWTRVLAHAVRVDPRPDWRDALVRAVRGLRDAFAHPARPAWRLTSAPTTSADAETAELAVFVDATARACRALCAAAEALDDDAPAAAAIAALEHVVPKAYSRGAGVAHALTRRLHGPSLLLDATLVAHALVVAQAWRDQPVYRDLADELVRSAQRRLAHPDGALGDRRATLAGANAVGRLAEPLRPLEANADAARVLAFLGEATTPSPEALCILQAIHPEACQAAGFAAPVTLAWAAVLAPERRISLW